MTDPGGASVRRPADKSELMDSMLAAAPGGAFKTYRDAMVFAAALGLQRGRKSPFEASSGPIEFATMINRYGAEDLIDVIAFADTGDVDVLGQDRLPERLRIFEAYANGGLEVLQEAMAAGALTPSEAVLSTVKRELASRNEVQSDVAPNLPDLGKALGLS